VTYPFIQRRRSHGPFRLIIVTVQIRDHRDRLQVLLGEASDVKKVVREVRARTEAPTLNLRLGSDAPISCRQCSDNIFVVTMQQGMKWLASTASRQIFNQYISDLSAPTCLGLKLLEAHMSRRHVFQCH
jgi:hypothetical protein